MAQSAVAQNNVKWVNVDSLYQPLPTSIRVFKTIDALEGKPNVAYYLIADLKDKDLLFTTDTTYKRRLTPTQFHQKNKQPLVVVNCTFFSFGTNQNLNAVVKDGKLVSYNASLKGRGKDTLTFSHVFSSALGITKKRTADVAWLYTDSSKKKAYALQLPLMPVKDSVEKHTIKEMVHAVSFSSPENTNRPAPLLHKWKMQTAVGGGPVLLQAGTLHITNEEERKFYGNAINDRHPRTAMGYTADHKLVILVVQGRYPGTAEGATLAHTAQLLQDIGCVEALNLDGGGSSCLLINGKETITPSEKGEQRAVPAVFIITESTK